MAISTQEGTAVEMQDAVSSTYVFSSESVSEGHPDEVCDYVADSILDAYLKLDPRSHVACEVLAKSGHLILTHALQSVRTGATVRVRSGQRAVIDGPYAETKEQRGGFFLIEARDLAEAIDVASRWPSARLGSIEVRPIEEVLREERRY